MTTESKPAPGRASSAGIIRRAVETGGLPSVKTPCERVSPFIAQPKAQHTGAARRGAAENPPLER